MKTGEIIQIIDEMIIKERKYYHKNDSGGTYCGLCMEDDYCNHEIRIDVLTELKQRILKMALLLI